MRAAIVIEPVRSAHTSVAILDALKAVQLPAAEVHLTDVNAREPFRHVSYAGMACQAHFIGMGFDGYRQAMAWMAAQAVEP
jgi:3-dehydroquinate dehydratase-2